MCWLPRWSGLPALDKAASVLYNTVFYKGPLAAWSLGKGSTARYLLAAWANIRNERRPHCGGPTHRHILHKVFSILGWRLLLKPFMWCDLLCNTRLHTIHVHAMHTMHHALCIMHCVWMCPRKSSCQVMLTTYHQSTCACVDLPYLYLPYKCLSTSQNVAKL